MKKVSNGQVFARDVARQSISFALHWQKSIGSRDDMAHAFEELRQLVKARAILHVRQDRGSRNADSAARDDPSAGRLFARPPRSYAAAVLNENLYSAIPGKVWLVSDVGADTEMRARLRRAEIADIAIVPLENAAAHSDFLEIEFADRVPQHDRMLLEMLCPLIAEAWQGRHPGAIAGMIAGRAARVARERPASEAKPILDADNPAGLTRSEFQVCMLIHQGHLPEEIAKTLNVKKSTLRSHMRSIYHKTGVSGQVQLVHRLHGAAAAAGGARA